MNYEKLITNILERYNIEYWLEGKNVSADSVNIQCPFHSCGDHSNHMGIFKDTLVYHCWKCHRKGHFSYLLKILTSMTDSQCEEEIENEKILLGIKNESTKSGIKKEKQQVSPLPEFFEKIEGRTNFPLLFKYLKRRKLSLDLIIEKGCGVCRVGPYMNRLIIPVYFEGKQVSFAAADMTGTALVPYHFPGQGTINEYLYGYDEIEGNTIVVAEGILDAWRIGDNAVSIFGSYLSASQKTLLIRRNPENLIFCMDGDAYWHAREVAAFFHPFIDKVEVIRMGFEEDPDSLGTDKIWKLIEDKMFPEEESIYE